MVCGSQKCGRGGGAGSVTEVFISYKREERELIRPIEQALTGLGVDVWLDERIAAGAAWGREINERLRSCRAQIVCWSPQALESDWVCGEAQIGLERNVLVPVKVLKCDLGPPFNRRQTIELVGWNGDSSHAGWRMVLQQLSQLLGRDLSEIAVLARSRQARSDFLEESSIDDDNGTYWETATQLNGVTFTVAELTFADALAKAAQDAARAVRAASNGRAMLTVDNVFDHMIDDSYGPRAAMQLVWTLGALRESPVVNLPFAADDPIGQVAERALAGARAAIEKALASEFSGRHQIRLPAQFKLRFVGKTKSALTGDGGEEDATVFIGRMLSGVKPPSSPQDSVA